MNMFMHELKAYRKSTMIWAVSMVALVILFMSMYPAISKDAEEFIKMLQGFPEPVRKAFGLSVSSIASPLGFYSFVFTYVTLCGSIQAMNFGTSIISKEMREKTADFLLTKPVTRTKIMTSKLLAVVTSLLLTDIVYFLGAYLMATAVTSDEFSTKIFFMISSTLFFLQLMFLALGTLVSVIFPKLKSVLSVSLSTVFIFFIISVFIESKTDVLRYFTPFKYFDTSYIINNAGFEGSFLLAGTAVVLAAVAASYVIYNRKDVHAV